ncbi:MAG: hypothetical protein ACLRMZ_13610 [Blautia marasmi]
MALKIIDVSEHNGRIDWEEARKHIDGVIIRCGYGMDQANQDDKYWKRNADECTRLEIPFGVYLYMLIRIQRAGVRRHMCCV